MCPIYSDIKTLFLTNIIWVGGFNHLEKMKVNGKDYYYGK
jgi:hypothetical protein